MKKIVACTLSALMVFGMIPQGVSAQRVDTLGFINQLDLSKSENVRLGQLKNTIDSIVKSGTTNLGQTQKEELFAPDEKVVVIVDVDTESVMDKFEDSNEKDVQTFIEDNKEVRQEVQKNVEKVADKVVDKVEAAKGADEVDVLYSYDTVFTGVAMEVPYGQLDTIKKIKGVKTAFVAATYQVPEEQKITAPEIGTNMITSRDLISTGKVQNEELNYTGQGMVVAVLDTGIAYRHAAFGTAPVNPSVTVDTVADAIANLDLVAEDNFVAATGGTLVADETSANSVYKSSKVPFGYDYTDNDTEITPIDSENHGTHVSGTIAGNSDVIKGVAPDAQLMGMKVFNDKGSTNDAVLFAALQDAVLLDVDVINMSLGSSSGFTVESNAALQQVYDCIEAVGINLDVSAGNAGTSAQKNNFGGMSQTKDPSASTVGSPSTLNAALSVASVENTFLNYSHFILAADGTRMGYIDNGSAGKEFATLGAGTFEYVNCGLGTPEEVAAAGDLTGKIALVQRGSISFTDKCKNVADAKAKAMVLYNNASGTISMSIENYLVPAVSIEMAAGETLIQAINPETKVGTFNYDASQTASLPSPTAGQMSDFSSWGPTPELTMKPEITAPGGNIYSSTQMSGDESQYGLMSGTSMAAPHMSGASALVKEYVEGTYPDLDPLEVEILVNNLMMSTAVPVIESASADDSTPVAYYSPRKQGAGLVDVYNAITSKGYLTVEDSVRPKAELGSNNSGSYSFLYTIHNQSDQAIKYDLSGAVQLEGYVEAEGYKLSTTESMNITGNGAKIRFVGADVKQGVATVKANNSTKIRVEIKIDKNNPEIVKYMEAHPNGFFVEGFVFADDKAVKMNIPFMGFCGDWGKIPAFDSSVYERDQNGVMPSFENGNNVYNDVSKKNIMLGGNIFAQLVGQKTPLSADQIAISSHSLGNYAEIVSTSTYLMRGVANLTFTYTDPSGNVVAQFAENNVSNSTYNSKYDLIVYAEAFMNEYPSFSAKYENGNPRPEGEYTLTIKAVPPVTGGEKLAQTISYKILVDHSNPVINRNQTLLFQKDGNVYLNVSATDNDFLSGWEVSLKDNAGKDLVGDQFVIEHKANADGSKVKSKLYNLGKTEDLLAANVNLDSVTVTAFDYAANVTVASIPMEKIPTVGNASVTKADSTAFEKITVEWNKADNATGYRVYKAEKLNGRYVQIADVKGQDALQYVDSKVKFGKSYFYKVCSYVQGTYMGKPIEVRGQLSQAMATGAWTPKGTKVVFASSSILGTTQLAWNRIAGVSGYEVLRKAQGEADYSIVRTLKSDRYVGCIDITPTQRGVKYSYVVKTYVLKNGVKYYGTPSQEIVLTARSNFGRILGFFK